MRTTSPLVAVLVLAVGAWTARAEPSSSTATAERVVLLRNGQVLRGGVSQLGEQFIVNIPTGELRVKASEVELVCNTLEQGYAHKRARIERGKVQEHLELAQWCIRHELLGSAAAELSDAFLADPRHPRIALVERQLELARRRDGAPRAPSPADASGPSNHDLDRLVRGLPPGTIEAFGHSVQPLLLNTCTTAGCHGPQSETKLRLLRIPLGKPATRRLTQRNLHAVLEMVNTQDPAASPLLTVPIAPHGNAKAPIFTSREAVQYRQLVNWTYRVAARREPAAPATTDKLPGQADTATAPSSVSPASKALGFSDVENPPPDFGPPPPREVVPASAEEEPYQAADEFDAEEFNRRFAPK